MALYVPLPRRLRGMEGKMVSQARKLLAELGYGSAAGPLLEVGIGIDCGEAFVGNVGERWLFDFTTVGDVVNTASRLEGAAAGGEILISERLAGELPGLRAEEVRVPPKGDARPLTAYRVLVDAPATRPEEPFDAQADSADGHFDRRLRGRGRRRTPVGRSSA
jgi:adenylate cyclase